MPVCVLAVACLLTARPGCAEPQGDQSPASASPERTLDDAHVAADTPSAWTTHVDGQLFATFNRQGGSRGGVEFGSQNWIMGMASRPLPLGTLTLSGMITAEPLTVGLAGYAEILQEGEAYRGLQITDHQHPHDLFMQLTAGWRLPMGDRTSVTLAGGPAGEAALGPVAFMHRASSAENPTAPLSHHIFDSTHIAEGVVLGRVDRGPVSIEGSIFHGREPDADRVDLDLGALDSWSTRIWVRPAAEWTLQASYGFLHQPEQLEPGDQRRTNASASWFRQRGSHYAAVTAAVGWNARQYSTVHAVLVEGTQHFGRTSIYGRFEDLTVETEILLFPELVHRPHPGELVDAIKGFTAGTVRDVASAKGLSFGVGGDVTFYQLPPLLQITHDPHPVSFHVFLRIARASLNDRMWNTTMAGHGASPDGMMTHHHHQ